MPSSGCPFLRRDDLVPNSELWVYKLFVISYLIIKVHCALCSAKDQSQKWILTSYSNLPDCNPCSNSGSIEICEIKDANIWDTRRRTTWNHWPFSVGKFPGLPFCGKLGSLFRRWGNCLSIMCSVKALIGFYDHHMQKTTQYCLSSLPLWHTPSTSLCQHLMDAKSLMI